MIDLTQLLNDILKAVVPDFVLDKIPVLTASVVDVASTLL